MKLNYFSLNTTLLGLSRLNNNVVKRRNTTVIPPSPSRPSGLIGQYKPYLNSNDSPTRDILKDYSGQGHDIQLYNFGYALGSGYGSWAFDPTKFSTFSKDQPYGTLHFTVDGSYSESVSTNATSISFKFRLRGMNSTAAGMCLKIILYDRDNKQYISDSQVTYFNDGIYSYSYDNSEGKNIGIYFYNSFNNIDKADFYVDILPDYPGALVSDGVDDYGLCETPFGEVGTVIVMLDEINWVKSAYLYDAQSTITNGRIYCYKDNTSSEIMVGIPNSKPVIYNKFIIFKRPPIAVTDKFNIFRSDKFGNKASVALYALEIYDHDLTDEEIESVKEAMYNEYLTATNALQNHIIADYECYEKTNEDEDRDVLKDLSGNGHDITLYNFGFAEGSGYGLYKENWKSSGANGGSYGVTHVKTYNSISVSVPASISNNFYLSKIREVGERINFKILVSGIPEGVTLEASLLGSPSRNFNLINGVNVIDITRLETDGNRLYFTYRGLIDTPYTITVKEIPEYQGALVSDGVDDYGLCENFPILNKEDGFTILAIREIPNIAHEGETATPFMMFPPYDKSPFVFEYFSKSVLNCYCFGMVNSLKIDDGLSLSYMTSKSYNGVVLKQGEGGDYTNTLCLFTFSASSGYRCSNIAFYRAMILNKDCTTEEIKFIAKQMVARHKEKTGETITLNI